MTNKRIWLSLAHMGGEEQQYIQQAFDTNWVVPLGPNVDGFEKDLQGFLQEDKVLVALSSGTAALHLALLQLGIGAGDEVICQSFTFSASANPIAYLHATPVFVDSEPETWNMDPALLEEGIQDRQAKTGKLPKAIIPVHLYGMPAKMDQIMEIANRWGIPVVEDAAEALGAAFRGRKCGTFGEYGILSFNGNKIITTSGGGALICSTEAQAAKTKFYATQARDQAPHYQHSEIGYNYRMSNICAGIGRGQMKVLQEHVDRRREINQYYRQNLGDIPGISFQTEPDSRFFSNFWLTSILVNPELTGGKTREDLRIFLDRENIETRPLWKPMHLQPIFAHTRSYCNGVSEALFRDGLCLPSGSILSEEDLNRVAGAIIRFFDN